MTDITKIPDPELLAAIIKTIEDNIRDNHPELPQGGSVGAFMDIPIRRGVTDEGTGILLKQVWGEKWG